MLRFLNFFGDCYEVCIVYYCLLVCINIIRYLPKEIPIKQRLIYSGKHSFGTAQAFSLFEIRSTLTDVLCMFSNER